MVIFMEHCKTIFPKKLYDGTASPAVERVAVILQGSQIVDILPADAAERIEAYHPERIDAGDKYMIPGLIDVHTHLMMEGQGPLAEETLSREPGRGASAGAAKRPQGAARGCDYTA